MTRFFSRLAWDTLGQPHHQELWAGHGVDGKEGSYGHDLCVAHVAYKYHLTVPRWHATQLAWCMCVSENGHCMAQGHRQVIPWNHMVSSGDFVLEHLLVHPSY